MSDPPDTDIEAFVIANMIAQSATAEAVIGIRYLNLRHRIDGFYELGLHILEERQKRILSEKTYLQRFQASGVITHLPRFTSIVTLNNDLRDYGEWTRRIGNKMKVAIACATTEKEQALLFAGEMGFLDRLSNRLTPFVKALAARGGRFTDASGNKRAECVRQVLCEMIHDRVVLSDSLPKDRTGLLHTHIVNSDLTMAAASMLYDGLARADRASLELSADLMTNLGTAIRGITTLSRRDLMEP